MLPFVRRCLSLLPYAICFGAAAYFAFARPFVADRFEDEVMEVGYQRVSFPAPTSPAQTMLAYARDPVAAQVGARLLTCRFPDPGVSHPYFKECQQAFIDLQVAARSSAAIPNFIAAIENWNRVPWGGSPKSWHRSWVAGGAMESLAALADRGISGAEEALRQLARDYPPLPRPYRISLPIYSRKGRSEAVIPWAQAEIERACQVPGRWHPAWRDSRKLLSDLAEGLADSRAPGSVPLLGRIFGQQILDNEDITAPYGFLITASGRDSRIACFDRVPTVPFLPMGRSLIVLQQMITVGNSIASTLLPASEEDLMQVSWLKKVLILVACAEDGGETDLPFLEALERDRGLIRETQSIDWSQRIRYCRIEDGSLPLEPGWEIVRTWSIQDLAYQTQAAIRERIGRPEEPIFKFGYQ